MNPKLLLLHPILTLLVMLLSLTSAPSLAHDIGISQTELLETATAEGSLYELRVLAPASQARRFPAPVLPEHCDYLQNPRGIQQSDWRMFEFTCAGGLTAQDELKLGWLRDGIILTARWADGSEARRLFSNDTGMISIPMAELQIGSGSWVQSARRYTTLGVEHILEGFDHLLFVLALLLIVSDRWLLIKTITAFTLAHSITLAIATLGYVNFPSRPVEAAIALSIVFLALEILHQRRGHSGLTHRAPWIVAFGFGLLHGLGFAGALSEIGLAEGEIPVALLFFNVGVELGQLLFVLVVLIIRWLLEQLNPPRPAWTAIVPAYLIGVTAMFWLLERVGAMLIPA